VDQANRLVAVRVKQVLSLPAVCELSFSDPEGVLGEASWPLRPGVNWEVAVLGVAPALFTGQVTAVEYGYSSRSSREVRVRGYDVLHRLRKRQPVRTHVQVTVAELAEQFAADVGLSVESSGSGPLWQRVIQHNQSDLDLLNELAGRCGLYLTVRDQTLHIVTLDGVGEGQTLRLGEELLEASVECNADAVRGSVSVAGWDPWRVEPHRGEAERPAGVRQAMAAGLFTERLGTTRARTRVNRPAQTDAEAEAQAEAEMAGRSASEVTLHGLAEGDPRLRPGTPVMLEGVWPSLAGRYVLTTVTHTIDNQRGYVSEISTLPPPVRESLRRDAGFAAMTIGKVIRTDDPQGLARVQVAYESYEEMESDWMSVLQAGAGAGKGMVVLPEIGDQVLVLLADGDPAQGVVLGGLYGSRVVPPEVAATGRGSIRPFTFLTPGGQMVRMDDQGQLVRVENSDGSYLELTPKQVRLHSQRDLQIEAPGRSVTIVGQAIDFKRG
jgi:uncharacterized protein involved in type VI secretion and phage assembly